MERQDRSVELFKNGYNCAQSICASYCDEAGWDEATAIRVASVFGDGIARNGDMCGSVAGALMVIGARFGSVTPGKKNNDLANNKAQEYIVRFGDTKGSVNCNVLRGFPAESKFKAGCHHVCSDIVREAALLLKDILKS